MLCKFMTERQTKMLEGLDTVDWSNLIHAYGDASDIPNDICELLSDAEDIREKALWRLFGNIYHQGTRYTATVAAIPFLTDAVLARRTPQTPKIIGLLAAIAEPTSAQLIEQQSTADDFRSEMIAQEVALDTEVRAECAEFGFWPTVESKVYDGVSEQVLRIWHLFEDADPAIPEAMTNLVRHFPHHWQNAFPHIKKLLEAAPSGEIGDRQRAFCLQSMKYATQLAGVKTEDNLIYAYAAPEQTVMTRACALLAVQELSGKGIAGAFSCLDDVAQLYQQDRKMMLGNGWTAAKLVQRLFQEGQRDREQFVPKIILALKAASEHNASSEELVRVLVELICHPHLAKGHFANVLSKDLSQEDREALIAIADYGQWRVGDSWLGNFTFMIKEYGLPDRPDKLRKYAKRKSGWFR